MIIKGSRFYLQESLGLLGILRSRNMVVDGESVTKNKIKDSLKVTRVL